MSEKIKCAICGEEVHAIQIHLRDAHPDWNLGTYAETYPDAPTLSAHAMRHLEKKRAEAAAKEPIVAAMVGTASSVTTLIPAGTATKQQLHEVFDLGAARAALSTRGDPISISVISSNSAEDQAQVPLVSDHYVYDIDELKNVILALELNIPCMIWGHKGSGKSELAEQVCARTNRPAIRIQHTVNTEESHILGQWTVKGGETVFELGPLPVAMQRGMTYVADEYDFGSPSVLSVYQSVLEGKALVIKEAPADMRVITPHKNFRFLATGNTNGSGDDTGLYQGTMMQNSANYDRFGIVIHKQYMDRKAESQILQNHCRLTKADADKMVEFASLVRQAYDGAKMGDTISPRTLIFASKIGVMRGSFRVGLTLSFISKLNRVDAEVADGLSQRIFGA